MAGLNPRRRSNRPPRAALKYPRTPERTGLFGPSRPWGAGDSIGLLVLLVLFVGFFGVVGY